jgi:hypothetical protein
MNGFWHGPGLPRGTGRLLCGCPALVPKDPVRGEGPVPRRPPERAMAHFPGECGRRNGEDWALGMG